jgi:hypothetical protein
MLPVTKEVEMEAMNAKRKEIKKEENRGKVKRKATEKNLAEEDKKKRRKREAKKSFLVISYLCFLEKHTTTQTDWSLKQSNRHGRNM